MKDSVTRLGIAQAVATPPRRNALDEVLDRIYERHVADVDRWVRRLVGPREDVEDIVHDVFLVAVRRRGSFRGDASVKTWLFRIAHHVVRGRRRRDRVRRWLFQRHADGLSAASGPITTPLEEIEQREQAARLYAALDRLPDDYRTALILYEIEGLSGEEVAELLDVQLGTIWVRLHRGRARLLRELSSDLSGKEDP
jgi:RNA polymerase sigma-70 factor, ECF subfamily